MSTGTPTGNAGTKQITSKSLRKDVGEGRQPIFIGGFCGHEEKWGRRGEKEALIETQRSKSAVGLTTLTSGKEGKAGLNLRKKRSSKEPKKLTR